ncbi:MAG TPA: hypothetical protein VE666_15220, partial [Mycobacterium sp.]|nr:hypothetical protein [Mycobacterium sp.]
MSVSSAELRALVREVVRDAVADLTPPPAGNHNGSAPPPANHNGSAPTPPVDNHNVFAPTGPLNADERSRVDTVRIATDSDLDSFVRQLLRLFENPKTRADLRNGRLTFRLAAASSATTTHRIETGAVTERHIVDIAASGGNLTLGRRAVLTPLAREKARALGVSI